MKFNFKVITSVAAVVCIGIAMTVVIAMDSNSKEVPSQAGMSVSLESIGSTTEDTQDITVEKEEIDKVTSVAPETEETEIIPEEPEITPQEPQLTPEELEWQNYLMADVEVSLNIRAEASMEGEITGCLRRGDRATVLEAGSEWTKIKSGKVEGYVNNAYCLYGADALTLAKEVCETVAVCTTEGLRVREGMSTESEVVGLLEEGNSVVVDTAAQTEAGWVAVIYESKTCYVSADYVTVSMNIGEALTIEEVVAIEEEKQEDERRQKEEAARQEAIKNAQSNKEYAATVEEVDLLAALIYCEAGAEPYEAKLAVGAVVVNRLERGTYGKTIADVIYQPGQFTPACDGKVNNALINGTATESCYQAAREALSGIDNTNGAIYFNDNRGIIADGIFYGNMVFYYKWHR